MTPTTMALGALSLIFAGATVVSAVHTRDDGPSRAVGAQVAAAPAGSTADAPSALPDLLPNASWQWPGGARSASDLAVVGTVRSVRAGTTRQPTAEPEAPTPTALVEIAVERYLGARGRTDQVLTLELPVAVPVGGAPEQVLDSYRQMGRSLWLVDTRAQVVNPEAVGQVTWLARVVGPTGMLVGLSGQPVPPDVTLGVDTLDKVEREAAKPNHKVDPKQRRTSSSEG